MLSQITYYASEQHSAKPVPVHTKATGRVILFVNVDGTLLDERHNIDAPRHLLEQMFEVFNVVWVSSRTLPELFALQESLSLFGECIGEGGGIAASYTPLRDDVPPEWEVGGPGLLAVQCLAAPISETTALVRSIAAKHKVPLQLYSDYSPNDLVHHHGQTRTEAERSSSRRVSVLIDCRVISHPTGATFLSRLRRAGCTVRCGGEWISVIKGANVGTAVRQYRAALRRRGDLATYTVGIGSDAKDIPFLKAVDHPFVTRHSDCSRTIALTRLANATLLARAGYDGWVEMMDHLTCIAHESNERADKMSLGDT